MITAPIDVTDHRDVATTDISSAFLQDKINELVPVVSKGIMVHLLLKIDPIYENFVHVNQDGKKVLESNLWVYESSKLILQKTSYIIVRNGLIINSYNLCTTNKVIKGK